MNRLGGVNKFNPILKTFAAEFHPGVWDLPGMSATRWLGPVVSNFTDIVILCYNFRIFSYDKKRNLSSLLRDLTTNVRHLCGRAARPSQRTRRTLGRSGPSSQRVPRLRRDDPEGVAVPAITFIKAPPRGRGSLPPLGALSRTARTRVRSSPARPPRPAPTLAAAPRTG